MSDGGAKNFVSKPFEKATKLCLFFFSYKMTRSAAQIYSFTSFGQSGICAELKKS